jgi:hypothetical protein
MSKLAGRASEGVLEIREEARFIEELRSLEMCQLRAQRLLGLLRDHAEVREGHILADNPASTFAPQLGQTAAKVAPHSRQKRAPSRLSEWHRGHSMEPPGILAGEGRNGDPRVMPQVSGDQGHRRVWGAFDPVDPGSARSTTL